MEQETSKWYTGDYCQLLPGECDERYWGMVLAQDDQQHIPGALLLGTTVLLDASELYPVTSEAFKAWIAREHQRVFEANAHWRGE